jgi:hypothetical protein
VTANEHFVPPVPELLPGYAEALRKLREEFGEPKTAKERRKLEWLEAKVHRDHFVDPSMVPGALWAHEGSHPHL